MNKGYVQVEQAMIEGKSRFVKKKLIEVAFGPWFWFINIFFRALTTF